MLVYRIQPIGLKLDDHRSTTSNDELDKGVHVCCSIEELKGAVRGWIYEAGQELVTIEVADQKYLRNNSDFEGFVLIGNRGKIVARQPFTTRSALRKWANS